MNLIYSFPFSYFYFTRLRHNSLAFHLVFEWLAVLVLLISVGPPDFTEALMVSGISYFAFISLYEIGYIVNDLFSSKREVAGRMRGPHGVTRFWVAIWVAIRIISFLLFTFISGKLFSYEWWSFFAALFIVFSMHNLLINPEFKIITFLWLTWLRFMAPLIFVIQGNQLFGVGLAAAMTYMTFRLLGYLDGKALLKMPNRREARFRLFFFMMPLVSFLMMWPYEEARGFLTLIIYYASVAALGSGLVFIHARSGNN
jgi:hypothetical protein